MRGEKSKWDIMTKGFIVIDKKTSFSKEDVVAVVRSVDRSSYSVYLRGGHKLDIFNCTEDDINNLNEFFENSQ
jgi:hypothetical protein